MAIISQGFAEGHNRGLHSVCAGELIPDCGLMLGCWHESADLVMLEIDSAASCHSSVEPHHEAGHERNDRPIMVSMKSWQ